MSEYDQFLWINQLCCSIRSSSLPIQSTNEKKTNSLSRISGCPGVGKAAARRSRRRSSGRRGILIFDFDDRLTPLIYLLCRRFHCSPSCSWLSWCLRARFHFLHWSWVHTQLVFSLVLPISRGETSIFGNHTSPINMSSAIPWPWGNRRGANARSICNSFPSLPPFESISYLAHITTLASLLFTFR